MASLGPPQGQHYIAGRWLAGAGAAIPVQNPATGEDFASINEATDAEIEQAVAAAQDAFAGWAATPASARAGALVRLGALIRANQAELAQRLTREQGKPLNEAAGEVAKLADICDFYAAEATRITGEIMPHDDPAIVSEVIYEPIGVVAAITPWNYPLELVGWKLCAALAAGCTLVLKPASISPLVAQGVFALLDEAGVPAGVANLVHGTGTSGAKLAAHPAVAKVAFTGSSEVGVKIQRGLPNIKRLGLELGGNCPLIATAGADLAATAAGATKRSFRNAGQICVAVNRIYVHEDVADELLARMRELASKLVIDDGLANPEADVGPLASAAGLRKVEEHVADARAKGANILCGGERLKEGRYAKGNFYPPTIIAAATAQMRVMREETFGPVVGVSSYADAAEAVALANDTPYGLAAYVYTQDLGEAHFFARRLVYGTVGVNTVDPSTINVPYGGRKQSGIGYEHAREGMLEYLAYKHVRINHA